MKNRERESFVKSFLLFYISIQVLVLVIAYLYYQTEVSNKKESLLLQMKNYSLSLSGEKFQLDIASKSSEYVNYTLYEDGDLFALFPIEGVDDTLLKVVFEKKAYNKELLSVYSTIGINLFISTLALILISVLFSLYSLKPLRQSVSFLEEFLKDMIHDLNTPVTAILLNSRLLKKKYKLERVQRIEVSAKTIGSLHRNLETFIRDVPLVLSEVDVKELLQERIEYFTSIYRDLHFKAELNEIKLLSNRDALLRVVDNIISNACKYNKPKGSVSVELYDEVLIISDTGMGIKDVKKIFERFYKEGERGLGIGLNIVQKLCEALDIKIEVESSENGSKFSFFFNKTHTVLT